MIRVMSYQLETEFSEVRKWQPLTFYLKHIMSECFHFITS